MDARRVGRGQDLLDAVQVDAHVVDDDDAGLAPPGLPRGLQHLFHQGLGLAHRQSVPDGFAGHSFPVFVFRQLEQDAGMAFRQAAVVDFGAQFRRQAQKPQLVRDGGLLLPTFTAMVSCVM